MQTAVQYLEDEDQMQQLYWQRAQAYRAASQFPAAERTLLAIRRWDAAAEMYKAASMYGDYLRLMKQRPEQLPAARAWVAQELETSGHLRYGVVQPGSRRTVVTMTCPSTCCLCAMFCSQASSRLVGDALVVTCGTSGVLGMPGKARGVRAADLLCCTRGHVRVGRRSRTTARQGSGRRR